jgi:ABC-type transport system involved in multi-copper enzyme maturation permease subunit
VIGLFVGAPLIAREVEQGTYLLIWSQGTTRRRWFFSIVALVAVATVVGVSLLAIPFTVWLAAQQPVANTWYQFDVGPVMVAYSLFALALGIAIGSAIQRVLPAMAATLVGFIAVRLPIAMFARPSFLPPLTWEVGRTGGDQSGLFIGPQQHVDPAGHLVSDARFIRIPNLTGDYATDAALANERAGYSSTPPGYVWHHVENCVTMQLIPQAVHDAVRHTGGAAVIAHGEC